MKARCPGISKKFSVSRCAVIGGSMERYVGSGKESQRGDSGSIGICAQLLVSPDAVDVGTGRGCGRMVDVGSVGVGGTGMTQLKGLRTSKTPRVPAPSTPAAFPAFVV
jgi:hypothetical protein